MPSHFLLDPQAAASLVALHPLHAPWSSKWHDCDSMCHWLWSRGSCGQNCRKRSNSKFLLLIRQTAPWALRSRFFRICPRGSWVIHDCLRDRRASPRRSHTSRLSLWSYVCAPRSKWCLCRKGHVWQILKVLTLCKFCLSPSIRKRTQWLSPSWKLDL